jgi:hypothetical protein
MLQYVTMPYEQPRDIKLCFYTGDLPRERDHGVFKTLFPGLRRTWLTDKLDG